MGNSPLHGGPLAPLKVRPNATSTLYRTEHTTTTSPRRTTTAENTSSNENKKSKESNNNMTSHTLTHEKVKHHSSTLSDDMTRFNISTVSHDLVSVNDSISGKDSIISSSNSSSPTDNNSTTTLTTSDNDRRKHHHHHHFNPLGFLKLLPFHHHKPKSHNKPTTYKNPKRRPIGYPKVLLHGTTTAEEHYDKIKSMVALAKTVRGHDGLRQLGFEYRVVPCEDHNNERVTIDHFPHEAHRDHDHDEEKKTEHIVETTTTTPLPPPPPRRPSSSSSLSSDDLFCHGCITCLYSISTSTRITDKNRKQFIADGEHYDTIAQLCMETAQELMILSGDLEWVTICDDETLGEPIRALVTKTTTTTTTTTQARHSKQQRQQQQQQQQQQHTLLIATGKGKVRCGIFSRHHLLTTSVESSTALPLLRDASVRRMSVVMLDPNARGDRKGMDTFERSMEALLHRRGNDDDDDDDDDVADDDADALLHVLAHSQAGAQLVRYLRDRDDGLVKRIRAVAFTDSTHNIQWAKDNRRLFTLLESDSCLYFKSAKESSSCFDTSGDEEEKERAGEEVTTDSFWQHRFGRIRTLWAGTKEHALTNWTARSHIWDHFDSYHGGVLYDKTMMEAVGGELSVVGEEQQQQQQQQVIDNERVNDEKDGHVHDQDGRHHHHHNRLTEVITI